MALKCIRHAALVATLVSLTGAQIVPEDLRGGFNTKGKEIQVSYVGEAVNGFRDGTSFEKDAVTSEPTFALGDSSGISPSTLYTILMVDTTCPNARKLHYARANFKNNFNGVNIETQAAALLDYKAPGAFGEAGDNRQYSFLLYTNPGRKQIDQLKLPAEGENFDVKQFQDDNGLSDASAGVGMVVKLGGTADCGGDSANTVPENLPTPRPPQISSARAPTSNAGQQPSNQASATPTGGAQQPAPTGSGRTSNLVVASSVLESDAPGPSTITSTIILSSRPGGAGTPTASASLIQQTTNAAPGMSVPGGAAMVPLFAVAGALFW
ncbi:hypothetical protein BKA66DRAFT_514721 [Pyrenochaeta sp. MPI-SDFR-AT-0127]|nr:hypothetical protein BKA66DRAFT_514721 [Pyrenochaeta sp. MPI-SDFR-AT-0127]